MRGCSSGGNSAATYFEKTGDGLMAITPMLGDAETTGGTSYVLRIVD